MPTKIIGTAPYQVPRNADLGSAAFQDADAIKIGGGTAVLSDVTVTNLYNDTSVSDVKPSLVLDFVNSQKVDSRISFSRPSIATYYDGETTAVAEQNLLTYSSDCSSWSGPANVIIGTNATTAPDGTLTADSVIANTIFGYHGVQNGSFVGTVGETYTFSVYAKSNGFTKLIISDLSNGHAAVRYDLSTGTIINTVGSGYINSSITSVGNGWYRCTVTYILQSASGYSHAICGYMDSGTTLNQYGAQYAGDGINGVYIWGAQLEQRSVATVYTPTTSYNITNRIPVIQTAATNVPRIDFDPITGECKGLLIEETRTNLLTYSDQFENSAWNNKNLVSVQSNVTVAPDGNLTADKINETASAGYHYIGQTVTVVSGTTYTISVYAKAAERRFLNVQFGGGGFNQCGVGVDLITGYKSEYNSPLSSSITSAGNGWWKISVTATATGTNGVPFFSPTVSLAGSGQYVGDINSGVYIWGAQMEVGRFPTSYIPSLGTTATRSADIASITGTNFNSWFRQDEGTVYASSYIPQDRIYSGVFRSLIQIIKTSTYNYESLFLLKNSAGQGSVEVKSGNVRYVSLTNTTASSLNLNIALSYKQNDFAMSVDGNSSISNNVGNIPYNLDRMIIGNVGDNNSLGCINGYIKRIAYYPKRLSNAELQEITL